MGAWTHGRMGELGAKRRVGEGAEIVSEQYLKLPALTRIQNILAANSNPMIGKNPAVV